MRPNPKSLRRHADAVSAVGGKIAEPARSLPCRPEGHPGRRRARPCGGRDDSVCQPRHSFDGRHARMIASQPLPPAAAGSGHDRTCLTPRSTMPGRASVCAPHSSVANAASVYSCHRNAGVMGQMQCDRTGPAHRTPQRSMASDVSDIRDRSAQRQCQFAVQLPGIVSVQQSAVRYSAKPQSQCP